MDAEAFEMFVKSVTERLNRQEEMIKILVDDLRQRNKEGKLYIRVERMYDSQELQALLLMGERTLQRYRTTGELPSTEQCFVSLDRQTNELVHYPLSRLNLRESVGNVKFTPEEMELLKQGGMVKDKHFENDKGQKFTVDFQVSADRKNVAFVPGSSRQEVAQEQEQKTKLNWTNEDGSIKNLTKWKGITLTEEQQKDYREGKSVKLDNYPLKDGTPATMYLMFYPDKGQPFASKNDPMQGKVVAPANESETQVAVNHQGKTNE